MRALMIVTSRSPDVAPDAKPTPPLLLGVEDEFAILERKLRQAFELFKAMTSEHRRAIHWWLTEEFVDLELQAA